MKALIVDDDFVSRTLINTVLTHLKIHDINAVVSGEEALRAILIAHSKNQFYDLIFLDWIMKGEEGITILKEIREREAQSKSGKRSKIIMVTSVDNPDSVMDAFKKQCDQYVVKPISKEKIIAAMELAGIEVEQPQKEKRK